jgi:hypothetical protein
MKSKLRSAAASVAVIGTVLLSLTVAGPSVASADSSPTTSTSSTTSTTSIGGGDIASTTTTSSTTTVPVPDTGTAQTTTTAPVPPPATTVPAQQLSDLIQGLSNDVAQAQAVGEYLAARALAGSGTSPANQPAAGASADPVLVAAAAAQIEANTAQASAQQRYAVARYRIGQVAVALYLGEQIPHAGAAIVAAGDRSLYLSGVLDAEKAAAKQAKADLARDTTAVEARRQQADQAVQARTAELQAAASRAAALAQATAPASGSAVAAGAPVLGGGASLSLLTQESPTILGPPVLSADELTGWFSTAHHQANLTVPLATLAGAYETVGSQAGVRADIAFAQSVLETSYFGFPSFGQVAVGDNNFAGIGACDHCATGFHFPDAVTGVTAQMQLLHAYATTSQPFPGPLPGPFRVAGCCPTWMALTGVWATAPDYGIKILKLYRSMVQWALARRTAAAQL